jgi:hypothetical protein
MNKNLYCIALCAVKDLHAVEIGLGVTTAFAFSHEDALEIGAARARERWPEADGWSGHGASAGMLKKAMMREALGLDTGSETDEQVM